VGALIAPGRAARRHARRREREAAAPLAQREGLDPVRLVARADGVTLPADPGPTPALRTAAEVLAARFPPLLSAGATDLALRFARGDVVHADGTPWRAHDAVRPGDELWFHRELAPEHVPEAELVVLHRDEHLLVLDKPHGMASTPRGTHVLASALVRLRRATGIRELVPLHRLDRRTAGVLAFGIRPEERGAYQQLFARGLVHKHYLARLDTSGGASWRPRAGERRILVHRLARERGWRRTRVVDGEPNAVTELEVLSVEGSEALVGLRPATGRTHQLRVQLATLGTPILGDDVYPGDRPEADSGDLQLLARRLAFIDPITGHEHVFTSRRGLDAEPGEPGR